MPPLVDQVKSLVAMVEQRQYLQAIERFYDANATMQENFDTPRAGIAALLENERRFLESVEDVYLECPADYLVGEDRAAIHWTFIVITRQGTKIRLDEIAYQEWRGGKIVRERFYYDPAQRTRPID